MVNLSPLAKFSAVPNKVPALTSLEKRELAYNGNDGIIYIRKEDDTIVDALEDKIPSWRKIKVLSESTNVILDLNFEGNTGSTAIIDSSPTPKTQFIAAGSISSNVKMFGNTSGFFNGNSVQINTDLQVRNTSYVISVFIYPTSLTSQHQFIASSYNYVGNNQHNQVILEIDASNRLSCGTGNGNIVGGQVLAINTWYHAELNYDHSTQTYYLFLNGNLIGSGQIYVPNEGTVWYLGAHPQVNPSGFYGYMDKLVLIKDSILHKSNFAPPNGPDIANYYKNQTEYINTQVITTSYIDALYYQRRLALHFEGQNGSNIFIDSSPTPKTITALNSAALSNAHISFGTTSGFFSGVSLGHPVAYGGLLIAHDNSLQPQGDFTIAMWVWYNGANSFTQILISKRDVNNSSTPYPYRLYITGSSHLNFSCFPNGDTEHTIQATENFPAGVWTHAAVVKSGSTYTLYQNGISIGSMSCGVGSNTLPVYIGREADSSFGVQFNGYIDELYLYEAVAWTSNFTPTPYPLGDIPPPIDYKNLYAPNTSLLITGQGPNNSTTFTDLANSPATLTARGNTKISTDVRGLGTSSIFFDGTATCWIDGGTSPKVVFRTGDFCVEGRVYLLETAKGIDLLDTRTTDTNSSGVEISASSDGVGIYIFPNPYTFLTPIPLNKFVHVAVYRISGIIYAAIDGKVHATTYNLSNDFTENKLTIGTNVYNSITHPGAPQVGAQPHGYLENYRITQGSSPYPTTDFVPPAGLLSGTPTTVLTRTIDGWKKYQRHVLDLELRCRANGFPSCSAIVPNGTFESITTGYIGTCLLPDGRVWSTPYNATSARIYDPVANTTSTPSPVFTAGTQSASILLPDGRVFILPAGSGTAGKIYDPVIDTVSNTVQLTTVVDAFSTPILLTDGRVFCVPFNSTVGVIYDPVTNKVFTSSVTYPGNQSFNGGTLLPDGRVLLAPWLAGQVRIYDPFNDTVAIAAGTYGKHISAVLMSSGVVFLAPFDIGQARVYNYATNVVANANLNNTVANGFANPILMPDGRVFCIPYASTTARIYDPYTDTTITPPITFSGVSSTYNTGVMMNDGRIYLTPRDNKSTALIINCSTGEYIHPQISRSPFRNKI
jgi:hypothetical protein